MFRGTHKRNCGAKRQILFRYPAKPPVSGVASKDHLTSVRIKTRDESGGFRISSVDAQAFKGIGRQLICGDWELRRDHNWRVNCGL